MEQDALGEYGLSLDGMQFCFVHSVQDSVPAVDDNEAHAGPPVVAGLGQQVCSRPAHRRKLH